MFIYSSFIPFVLNRSDYIHKDFDIEQNETGVYIPPLRVLYCDPNVSKEKLEKMISNNYKLMNIDPSKNGIELVSRTKNDIYSLKNHDLDCEHEPEHVNRHQRQYQNYKNYQHYDQIGAAQNADKRTSGYRDNLQDSKRVHNDQKRNMNRYKRDDVIDSKRNFELKETSYDSKNFKCEDKNDNFDSDSYLDDINDLLPDIAIDNFTHEDADYSDYQRNQYNRVESSDNRRNNDSRYRNQRNDQRIRNQRYYSKNQNRSNFQDRRQHNNHGNNSQSNVTGNSNNLTRNSQTTKNG